MKLYVKICLVVSFFGMLALNGMELEDDLEYCIKAGIDPEIFQNTARHSLIRAIFNDDVQRAQILIENGVDINGKDETSPSYNTNRNYLALVRRAFQPIASLVLLPQIRSPHEPKLEMQATPLHFAVHYGSEKIVAMLLSLSKLDVNKYDDRGYTALHFAAQQTNKEIIKSLLLRDDVDINVQTYEGWTPLHLTVQFNNEYVLELLLSSPDLDVNITDKQGFTPLHIASKNGSVMGLKKLLAHLTIKVNGFKGREYDPFDLAVCNGHKEILYLFFDYFNSNEGCPVNSLNYALRVAHRRNDEGYLLSDRVDRVNVVQDHEGNTPLFLAIKNKFWELATKILLVEGIISKSEDAPHLKRFEDSPSLVEELQSDIERQQKIDHEQFNELFLYAILHSNNELVQKLLLLVEYQQNVLATHTILEAFCIALKQNDVYSLKLLAPYMISRNLFCKVVTFLRIVKNIPVKISLAVKDLMVHYLEILNRGPNIIAINNHAQQLPKELVHELLKFDFMANAKK